MQESTFDPGAVLDMTPLQILSSIRDEDGYASRYWTLVSGVTALAYESPADEEQGAAVLDILARETFRMVALANQDVHDPTTMQVRDAWAMAIMSVVTTAATILLANGMAPVQLHIRPCGEDPEGGLGVELFWGDSDESRRYVLEDVRWRR